MKAISPTQLRREIAVNDIPTARDNITFFGWVVNSLGFSFSYGNTYCFDCTVIESGTANHIKFIYTVCNQVSHMCKVISSNGMSVTGSNQYGTVVISGYSKASNCRTVTRLITMT